MSNFVGYGKISESSSQWLLDKTDAAAFKRVSWCVTEKIHGANFCFVCDESAHRIRCAKRTGLLDELDDFFGYKRRLLNSIRPKLEQLFHLVKTSFPEMEKLYVFGELFGGAYPHPDVPKVINMNAVQTGIWYSPDLEFCAFDLAIDVNEKQTYLNYDFAADVFARAHLLHAEPLFIGKYEDAIEYPLGFSSHIPSKLGWPPLNEPNKAEGIVVKPMQELLIRTTKGSNVRAIIKKKIAEFAEDKYSQAEKLISTNTGELCDAELLRFEIDALMTENRLNNALSKIGSVAATDKKKLNELLQLFISDIMDQLFENGNEQAWQSLSEADRQLLTDELTLSTKKLILRHLKQTKQ
jgi:Rnl2 family RNA ligase